VKTNQVPELSFLQNRNLSDYLSFIVKATKLQSIVLQLSYSYSSSCFEECTMINSTYYLGMASQLEPGYIKHSKLKL
jgi:hypothetical protein